MLYLKAFLPLHILCFSFLSLPSLFCLPAPTPWSGLSEAHDPSLLLRPLRGHPSLEQRCNLGIDFLFPCPLINHNRLLCIPKQLAKGGKGQAMSFTKPRRNLQYRTKKHICIKPLFFYRSKINRLIFRWGKTWSYFLSMQVSNRLSLCVYAWLIVNINFNKKLKFKQ